MGDEDVPSLVSQMLLPSEEVTSGPAVSTTLLPASSSQPSPAKTSSITPDFLTTSRQTQEEISQRLAEMAVQLRRNAQHFATALEDDKDALAEADSKLDTNLTVLQKERGRLGTYSSKSRGTTWLVILSILVVLIAWIVMFFVIRLT
jgi:SNARE protein 1